MRHQRLVGALLLALMIGLAVAGDATDANTDNEADDEVSLKSNNSGGAAPSPHPVPTGSAADTPYCCVHTRRRASSTSSATTTTSTTAESTRR